MTPESRSDLLTVLLRCKPHEASEPGFAGCDMGSLLPASPIRCPEGYEQALAPGTQAHGSPPEKGVMLWEKPEEKETRATGYTVQERYRSRWLSPISRYNHLCAGDTRESGSQRRLCSPQVSTNPEREARRGEAPQRAADAQMEAGLRPWIHLPVLPHPLNDLGQVT